MANGLHDLASLRKKSKNDNFNRDFLYPLLDKVNKEKKPLISMDDFNINIL